MTIADAKHITRLHRWPWCHLSMLIQLLAIMVAPTPLVSCRGPTTLPPPPEPSIYQAVPPLALEPGCEIAMRPVGLRTRPGAVVVDVMFTPANHGLRNSTGIYALSLELASAQDIRDAVVIKAVSTGKVVRLLPVRLPHAWNPFVRVDPAIPANVMIDSPTPEGMMVQTFPFAIDGTLAEGEYDVELRPAFFKDSYGLKLPERGCTQPARIRVSASP